MDGTKRVLGTEMLYRIEDPVARTTTRWDSGSKEAKVIHWPQTQTDNDVSKTPECPCDATVLPGEVVEKLGTKTIEGVVAEGTRMSYTVPAGQDDNDKDYVVVHETWYSPDLKIAIFATNDDPQSGSNERRADKHCSR